MNKLSIRLMIFSLLIALAGFTASAQDFQRSYNLGAGGSVNVRNISGDVIVNGYDGAAIIVTAIKSGRDRDKVNIEDRSAGAAVDVRVDYPDRCDNCDVEVRFEVKAPRGIAYKFNSFSSVSGDVSVTGVSGELTAKTVSGNTTVNNVNGAVNAHSVSGNVHVGKVAGTVSAKSTSGNVEVEIVSLDSTTGAMDFASISGDVSVKLPGNLDAEVKLSSMSGKLKTDFPLTIEESKYGAGRKANGRLGNGSRNLKISTISGDVSLLRQ
ncbi:MAG: DUF4097 family beta strand repeat-containing protein [Blastocatellia bacterium]